MNVPAAGNAGRMVDRARDLALARGLLTGYHADVHRLTRRVILSLDADAYERIIDRNWDPPVTIAVRLVSVVEDSAKHLGQAEYVRGVLLRRR